MKKAKKSVICPCGAKVWEFRSEDKLKSGRCNKCIRATKRPIVWKDSRNNIYTICKDCRVLYRYSKKSNAHRCKVGKIHSFLKVGKNHSFSANPQNVKTTTESAQNGQKMMKPQISSDSDIG